MYIVIGVDFKKILLNPNEPTLDPLQRDAIDRWNGIKSLGLCDHLQRAAQSIMPIWHL